MPGIGLEIGLGMGNKLPWSTYWSRLISATVETAAPSNIVLTFASARTSLGASDFSLSVYGSSFTINSASWSGNVLTLVLANPIFVFFGNPVITFLKTGQTATVTNNVADDGNTAAWYQHRDLTTITKDGSNKVSVWADKLGSGRNLLQATGANQPIWSLTNGVLFDGVNDYMKTLAFTYIQPEMIYFVGRQVTYQTGDQFIDGNASYSGLIEQSGVSPGIRSYAGVFLPVSNDLAINTFGIIRCLFNGLNSTFQVNNNTVIVSGGGANTMGGFTLASVGAGTGQWANIEVKEIILRRTVDNAAIQTSIYNYLKAINAVP
jgi:hypothetical protein